MNELFKIVQRIGRAYGSYISIFVLFCCPRAEPLTDKATHRVGTPSRNAHKADIPTESNILDSQRHADMIRKSSNTCPTKALSSPKDYLITIGPSEPEDFDPLKSLSNGDRFYDHQTQ
jgi:hypothetical protein